MGGFDFRRCLVAVVPQLELSEVCLLAMVYLLFALPWTQHNCCYGDPKQRTFMNFGTWPTDETMLTRLV